MKRVLTLCEAALYNMVSEAKPLKRPRRDLNDPYLLRGIALGLRGGLTNRQTGSIMDILLHELTADEWFDVYRQFRPGATREEFQRDWEEFQAAKAGRRNLKSVE